MSRRQRRITLTGNMGPFAPLMRNDFTNGLKKQLIAGRILYILPERFGGGF